MLLLYDTRKKGIIQTHMSPNMEKGPSCDICKKTFTKKSNMQRHISGHKGGVFHCDICKKVFTRREYLQRHMSLHDGEHSCDICKKTFTRKEYLQRHMSVHDGQEYSCDVCQKIFAGKSSLQNHMSLHDGKGFTCDICKKIFGKKINIQRHMSVHELETFPCSICKKMLTGKSMPNHMSVYHGKGFPCDICMKVFTNKANMIRHMSLHNGEEFSCDIYSEVLARKKSVQNTSVHQGKGSSFDICKKMLTNEAVSLQTRERFFCDICKKVFRRKYSLKNHMYRHQGVEFPCEICKKVFTKKACMITHMFLHEGVGFSCDMCEKVFRRKESLQNHMSLYHGKGFPCNICHNVFTTKGNMLRHTSVHKEKVFPSDRCKKVSKEMSETRIFFCPYSNCSEFYSNNRKLLCHVKSGHDGMRPKSTCIGHTKEPFSDVGDACVAGKATRDKMQEHIENLPASTFAAEECQQRKGGMQTHGGNALSSLTNSPQEYEHQRKWLLENKNMLHESLKLQSHHSKAERNEAWMNIKIIAVSLDDVLNNGHVTKASLQYSENFMPSAKDCGEQDSGLAQVVEARMDRHQQERQEQVCPLNFTMDVRERLYLMKRVMEEIFPTIKTVCLSTAADNRPHHAVSHSSC